MITLIAIKCTPAGSFMAVLAGSPPYFQELRATLWHIGGLSSEQKKEDTIVRNLLDRRFSWRNGHHGMLPTTKGRGRAKVYVEIGQRTLQ